MILRLATLLAATLLVLASCGDNLKFPGTEPTATPAPAAAPTVTPAA